MTTECPPGFAIHLPVPSEERPHLFFVISKPVDGGVVMVNLVTHLPSYHGPPEILLQPGDHPFIKRPSTILFRRADIGCYESLKTLARRHPERIDAPLPSRILAGIQEAAGESNYIDPRVLRHLRRGL